MLQVARNQAELLLLHKKKIARKSIKIFVYTETILVPYLFNFILFIITFEIALMVQSHETVMLGVSKRFFVCFEKRSF